MRVSVERMPGSTVAVDIYADDDEFSVAVDKAYQKINRDITIPGFRRGKAPKHIIERMVGRDAVVQEAGRDMMDGLFRRAIEQEELTPIGDPTVEILQDEPFGFKVTVAVFPEATLGDYQSVRVEPRDVELDEDEVTTVIEQIRKAQAEWHDVETPRQPRAGDQVILDLAVFDGDEPFQTPAVDAPFVLGESQMFEALEDAIKMMMPGNAAELTLAFEEDDLTVNPELRGKTLRYELTLKGVKERTLPEVDDELAKQAGPFETADEMLAQLRKDLLRNKATEARAGVYTEIVNAMSDTATIEVPTALVNSELDDEVTQLRTRLAQQGLPWEDYLGANGQTEEELREELRPNAERRVRNSVVLQEIAKAENIEVTPEDIEAEIERLVAPAENAERLRALYDSEYFKNLLQNELFDRKLTDRLIEIATEGRGAVIGAGAEALKEAEEPEERETVAEQAGETDLSDDTENVVEFARDEVAEAAAEDVTEAVEASEGPGPTLAEADADGGQSGDEAREDWSQPENVVDFDAELQAEDAAQTDENNTQAPAEAGE